MAKRKTTEQFASDLMTNFGIARNAFELLTPYQGYDKPILFKCNICGLKKEVIASSLLKKTRTKQHICRCYGYPQEWHDQLLDFQKWQEGQTDYELLSDFKGKYATIKVKCLKCGAVQKRSISSLLKSDGCLVCEKKCTVAKTPAQLQKELDEIYGGEYELIKNFTSVSKTALFRHTVCGKIYSTRPHYLLSQKGGTCPICKRRSKGEKTISDTLRKLDIYFEEQKRLENLKRCPYDFFVPSSNLLIEFQGIQHFQPIDRFGGEKSFQRQQEIDKTKEACAKEWGYDFLAIPYTQFADIESILVQRLSRGGEQRKQNGSHLEKDEDIV